MSFRSPDGLIARLVRALQWTIFVLGLSAVFHFLVVLAIPNITVMSAASRITDAGGLNKALHSHTESAELWLDGRLANPDILTSVCAFNLALGPVRISAQIPKALWSVSIYSDTRQLIYTIDEADVTNGTFDAIIAGTGQHFANEEDLREIHLARFTGIVVFRSIIDPGQDIKKQQTLNETSRCAALNDVLSKRHY